MSLPMSVQSHSRLQAPHTACTLSRLPASAPSDPRLWKIRSGAGDIDSRHLASTCPTPGWLPVGCPNITAGISAVQPQAVGARFLMTIGFSNLAGTLLTSSTAALSNPSTASSSNQGPLVSSVELLILLQSRQFLVNMSSQLDYSYIDAPR